MRRGDVVIFAQKGEYSGKPRPGVVIQSDALLADHPSILVCILSTRAAANAFYRIQVHPAEGNGLESPCTLQADKILTVRREKVTKTVGRIDEATLGRLNTALALIQGLA